MKTYIVKRSIESNEEPKHKGRHYNTNLGRCYFTEYREWFWSGKKVAPEYFFEELSLSQLIEELMPTEELLKFTEWVSFSKDLHFVGSGLWKSMIGGCITSNDPGLTTKELYNEYLKTQLLK